MKFLLHRFTALLLAVLLFCSAGGVLAFAAQTALPDPGCTLGTDPSDMLAAGGRRVTAGDRLFYVEENDGCVYDADHRKTPVLQGPVSKLNYADGVLYFAREREEGSFDLCAWRAGRRQFCLPPLPAGSGRSIWWTVSIWTSPVTTRFGSWSWRRATIG